MTTSAMHNGRSLTEMEFEATHYTHPEWEDVELYKIKMLGLSAPQQALITGGNIARLLIEVKSSRELATAYSSDWYQPVVALG